MSILRTVADSLTRHVTRPVGHGVDSVVESALAPFTRPLGWVQGFWRSGTTWMLQEVAHLAGARTVFEPFSPDNEVQLPLQVPGGTTVPQAHVYMPLGMHALDAGSLEVLDRAFRGDCRTIHARFARRGRSEYLRRDVVVNTVRLGFVMEPMLDRLGVPCLHVRRHPGAVLASLNRVRWPFFRESTLATAFAHEPEGPVKDTLLCYDGDFFARWSALWALSEAVVEACAGEAERSPTATPRLRVIDYEAATAEPQGIVQGLEALGISCSGRPRLLDSPTTVVARRGTGVGRRRSSWKDELDAGAVDRIRGVTTELFPGCGELWS